MINILLTRNNLICVEKKICFFAFFLIFNSCSPVRLMHFSNKKTPEKKQKNTATKLLEQ